MHLSPPRISRPVGAGWRPAGPTKQSSLRRALLNLRTHELSPRPPTLPQSTDIPLPGNGRHRGQRVVVGNTAIVFVRGLRQWQSRRDYAKQRPIRHSGRGENRLTAAVQRGDTTCLFVDPGLNGWPTPYTVTNRAVYDDDRLGTPHGGGLTTFGRGTPAGRSRRSRRGNPRAIGQTKGRCRSAQRTGLLP
jgi:hypothetical protein